MSHLSHFRNSRSTRAVRLALLVLLALLIGRTSLHGETGKEARDLKPSPQLSPQQVVEFQLRSLSGTGELQSRIELCYRFASPGNRFYTGPPKVFAEMIQSAPYASLLDAQHFLIGRPVVENNEAYVLVTLVDRNGELRMFRWFLSKQTNVQYDGCWMTDAVVAVGEVKRPDEPGKVKTPSV
jgi:hypothetical protein